MSRALQTRFQFLKAHRAVWRFAFLGLLIAARPFLADGPTPGLVVESVTPNWVAAASGFQPGDVLLSWTFRPRDGSEAQAGTLGTPFDLTDVFFGMFTRGELTFEGLRQGQAFSWTFRSVGTLNLGLEVRRAKDPASPRSTDSPRELAWERLRDATAAASAGDAERAERAFREAAEILLQASDLSARASVLREWTAPFVTRREYASARELLEEALALERQRAGEGLAIAYTQLLLAWLSGLEGDLAASEQAWLEMLAILEKVAPEGLEVARALDNLGYLALWRGDTAAAQERLNRAEAIQRPAASNTLYYASTLTKLGLLAEVLGELERAEALMWQALALNEQLAPGSPDHGGNLLNLAATLTVRGELAAAEDLLRKSVELIDRPEEDPWVAVMPHINLGFLALYRGDLAAAQSYFEYALGRLKKGPESIELAEGYAALAEVARKQRRFREARDLEKSALTLTERLAPGSLGWVARLQALARIESESGDLAAAEALLRKAEATALAKAHESPQADSIRSDLGRLLVQRRRLAEAEALYQRVLSNLERRGLAGTRAEAEIRNLLGDQQRRQGDLLAATENFCRAARIFDFQRSKVGGSLESRSWFEAETQSYYFDCLSALADQGLSTEAFHSLEGGKTRVFLQLLAERDLRIAGLPPELKAERIRLDAEYDEVLSQLSQAGTEDAGEIASLRARLEDIKAAKEVVRIRLRAQSPQLADLQAPEPLSLTEAREVLDPGTALLAYAVGPERSYLFVVRPDGEGRRGLEMHRLPIGRAALEKEIEAYRRLLTDPRGDLAALNARAARLYDLLLKPARKRLARAERILISADGPLHLLPWAALRRRGRYLAQWRPIHLVGSATVYAEIRRGRRPMGDPGTWRMVAFGDPRYPKIPDTTGDKIVADSEVRSALRRGLKLEPLPATHDEIRGIAALFPGAEVYLGEEATEERAKQASPRADLLHFAGHGLIDERFPLDSSLALTIPAQRQEGRDNGLLQAWEVFESFRLDAHLVTLSACDTAVGKEMGGEGLLGLTRAFQFAGARTVLSSLWSVSDVSTATLMKRFYSYLRQGQTKDEALRSAQLDLLRSRKEGFSHPYYWAGFSLYGDWR